MCWLSLAPPYMARLAKACLLSNKNRGDLCRIHFSVCLSGSATVGYQQIPKPDRKRREAFQYDVFLLRIKAITYNYNTTLLAYFSSRASICSTSSLPLAFSLPDNKLFAKSRFCACKAIIFSSILFSMIMR